MDWNRIIPKCVQDVPIKFDDQGKPIETAKDVATLDCIPAVVQNVIYAAFLFAGIVAVILIIYSGIKFIFSGGDPKQVEGARKTLTYAIIGFVVILFSVFILNLISTVTGVECIKFLGFTKC
jgi:type IV secretory pathway VirB2 component (pilin)